MIKIKEKDYDFNNLLGLNFDMLKEVLLNLLENQNNCKIEINNIKDSNDNRDKKISDLENKLTELTKYIKDNEKNNYIIKEIPIQKNFDEKEQNLGSNPNNFEKINDNMLNIEEEIEDEDDKDNIEEEKEDNKIDKTEEEVNDKNEIEEKVEDENKDDKNNLNGEEFNRDDSINIEAKISLIDNTFKDEEIIPKKEEKKVTIDIKQKEEEKKPIKTENKEIIEKEPVKPKKLSAARNGLPNSARNYRFDLGSQRFYRPLWFSCHNSAVPNLEYSRASLKSVREREQVSLSSIPSSRGLVYQSQPAEYR